MLLWRISNHDSLDGAGGLHASGRWHSRGRLIVYVATSVPGALLEHLVHLELAPDLLPDDYTLMKLDTRDEIATETVRPEDLPEDWANRLEITRGIGDAWLDQQRSARLMVPSAIVPETMNVLLNPRHTDAVHLQLVWQRSFRLDSRLHSPATNH